MKILTSLLFSCCLPVSAAVALVHAYSGTTFPKTITSTGAGNLMVIVRDASVTTGSTTLTGGGNQTPTLYGCLANSTSEVCVFYVASTNAGQTSITCTSCGTVNAMAAYEFSGTDTSAPLDSISGLFNTTAYTVRTQTYQPGYNSEAIVTAGNCSGSATSITGSTWGTTAFPGGEPQGELVTSSSFAAITSTIDSGCANTGLLIIGFKGAGATQQCAFNAVAWDAPAETGSSGNPTSSVNIPHAGALVVAMPWCIGTGCTIGAVTVGSDSATAIGTTSSNSSTTGLGGMAYDLSSTGTGAQTVTCAMSGTRTNTQCASYVFSYTSGCTLSHDVDASLGSGTSTAVNAPSITATAGDLEFAFSFVNAHLSSVNSPWVCQFFNATTESGDCTFKNTVNGSGYILSASGSSTANNMTQISANDWQALITSFKLAGSGSPSTTPGQFPRMQ